MKKLYSVYDAVAKEFAGPFMANNDGSAARMFRSWISSNAGKIKSTDYQLYCVAEFDISTGSIIPSSYEVAVNEGE